MFLCMRDADSNEGQPGLLTLEPTTKSKCKWDVEAIQREIQKTTFSADNRPIGRQKGRFDQQAYSGSLFVILFTFPAGSHHFSSL